MAKKERKVQSEQPKEKGNAIIKFTSPSEILLLYGLMLMILGATAFSASGYESKAKSALYMGNGSALICFMLAAGTRSHGKVNKGDSGFKIYMMSIHFALFFPVLMIAVISWRFTLAWSVPSKAYILPYLGGIIFTSLLSFISLYAFKPKKSKSKSDVDSNDAASTITSSTTTMHSSIPSTSNDSPSNNDSENMNKAIDNEDSSITNNNNSNENNTNPRDIDMSIKRSKSSSREKSHKEPVVRRRPRRAQAI